jgi:hypothetical protein
MLGHYWRHRRLATVVFISILAAAADRARSDEIDQCMANEQAAFEAPQKFTQQGEITCPSGDIVGFPPRIRRNDRSGSVTYTAPEGTIIQNRSIGSITIENVSQSNGSYGSPSISSDGRTVTVPIACNGKGPGEGRAWQNIRISGMIVRQPTPDVLKKWAIQCVRCVVEKNCPVAAPNDAK